MKFPLVGPMVAAAVVLSPALAQDAAKDKPAVPRFQVDPFWPKPLPNNWMLGQVSRAIAACTNRQSLVRSRRDHW